MNIRRIYHSIENTIGILSLIANVMLLYLILTKSQFRVKVYKTIMLVTCLLDLFYGIFCFIAQPTVFAESGYMIVMADGFFSCRWEFFDHFCCTIYCTFIHLTCIYVVAMFVYRYYIICCQNGEGYIRSITPVFWFAGLYCFMQSTNAFCMYCLGQTPEYRQIGLRVLDHNNWEYDPQMPPYPTVSFATQPKNILHHIIYLSSVTVGYTIIIFFQSSIMRYLGRHGKSEHEATRKMHNEVGKVMIALAVIPGFALIAPTFITVFFLAARLSPGLLAPFVSMFMHVITLANPLSTLYLVKPYRVGMYKILSLGLYQRSRVGQSKSDATSTHVVTVATTASITPQTDLSEIAA